VGDSDSYQKESCPSSMAAVQSLDRADAPAPQKLMQLYVDMMRDSGISAPVPLYVASGLLTYMQPDGE